MKKYRIFKFLRKIYSFLNKLEVNFKVVYKKLKEKTFIYIFGHLYNYFFNLNLKIRPNILMLTNGFYHRKSKEKSLEVLHVVDPLTDFIEDNDLNVGLFAWFFEKNRIFPLFRFLLSVYRIKPSIIVLSSHNPNSKLSSHFSYVFFDWLQTIMHPVQFVELGWDTVSSNYWASRKMEDFERKFCVFDQATLSNFFNTSFSKQIDCRNALNVFPTSFIIDSMVDKPDVERKIDFSFVGQVSSYRDYRFNFIKNLKNLDFRSSINTSGSRKHQIPRDAYLQLLKDSKISINFSQSVNGTHQIKLRVWEILLSGCLLLEQKNSETEKYFVDGLHYVGFDSELDLINKLNFYLKNQSLLSQIATNGQQHALSLVRKHDFEKYLLSYVKT